MDPNSIQLNFTSGSSLTKEEAFPLKKSNYFFLPKNFWMVFDNKTDPLWFVATFLTRCPFCHTPNCFGTTGIWPNSVTCCDCKESYGLSEEEDYISPKHFFKN